ncbi:MAG: PH domain-containing protein [Minisyncoccia bacterium]|jgi:membrane protein YdbS with pleckstrin-like domain
MDDHKKYSLGHRAFIYFLSRRIKFAVYLFVLAGVLWYSERWVPSSFITWSLWQDYATRVLFLLSIAYFLLMFLRTYMEYSNYKYIFTDEAFVMTSGFVVQTEVAALYHQIQNVNIDRGPLAQLAGVSDIVIVMIGSERNSAHNRIILPAVGKKRARLVQKELLVRARGHIAPVPAREE